MIDIDKVIDYIEKKNNIKLFDYQKTVLKELIKGNKVFTPRCAGRSVIYKGYADFLRDIESNDQHSSDADCGIDYHDVIKSNLLTKNLADNAQHILGDETFKIEYVGEYEK